MEGIKSVAFREGFYLQRAVTCAILLFGLHHASAQTIHSGDEDTGIPLEAFIEETSEFERLLERLWAINPAVQSVWGWQSDGIRPSHLGGRNQWQVRISAKSGLWQTGLIADKDMGEPLGSNSIPWKGPELKRWYLSRAGRRFHVLGGGFRIQNGYGLASGRRSSSMPSRSNPLRLPGKLATARGYAGSAGGAVRNGLLIGLEGRLGAIRMWQSFDRVAASTGVERTPDAIAQTIIKDVSGTSAFVTESSLVRRNAVHVSSSGIQTAIAGRLWQVAVIGEHVRLETTQPGLNVDLFGSHLPRSLFAGSLSGMMSVASLRMVAETTVPGGNAPSWRTALRWRHASGSGMILDIAQLNQTVASPYSGRTRLFADHDSEFTVRAAARWRRSRDSDWTLRGALRRRSQQDGVDATRRLALDWAGGVGADKGMQLQTGFSWQTTQRPENQQESMSRLSLRFTEQNASTWNPGFQVSAGYRRDRYDKRGVTGLAGVSLRRRALKSPGLGATRLNRTTSRLAGRAIPEWTTMVLVRRSTGVRTVLYATQPSVSGGFPVLSGSSDILIAIQRFRWKPTPSMQSDFLVRLDRRSTEQPVRYSLRLTIQLRIAL